MNSFRLATGGNAIDRTHTVSFTFDGERHEGFAGDSLAAALLGAGIGVVGRSFKYHRARGVWGFWNEEPNAIMDVSASGAFEPNFRATQVFLSAHESLAARSVNANPDARRDRAGFLDRLSRFLPAGFYYKTFIWPRWEAYETRIRHMAGLGRLKADWRQASFAQQRNIACDVLVIGAGRAGLGAAAAHAESGRDVILLDDRPEPGGSLLHRSLEGPESAAGALARIKAAGGRVFTRTSAFGIYEGHRVHAVMRETTFGPPVLLRIATKRIVLATGAIERPQLFANNDLPGVMSAEAGLHYLRRHGVAVGRNVVLATNNDRAYEAAFAHRENGLAIRIIDARESSPAMDKARVQGISVRAATRVAAAQGRDAVRSLETDDGTSFAADALLVSGGFTPTLHLLRQARGRVVWRQDIEAFVPAGDHEVIEVTGSAAGEGLQQLDEKTSARNLGKGRAWIDLQNDVTDKDIALAAREGFDAIEHLKRYTTLGMATDQGKTSNVNGLLTLSHLTGRSLAATGTTTFRPPYTPVPLTALAGSRHGELFEPLRRLVLEADHRKLGAVLGEYGGVLRPACYPKAGDPRAAVLAEARQARLSVGLFDASPLGKIEVIGPDAAKFLDFNFYGKISTLQPGRIRYGLMLQESGVVYDDGVVSRIDENRFIVSCSSGHVAGVAARFEEWRQDRFGRDRLFIHDATEQWATLCLTGPKSRQLAEELGLVVDLGDDVLPHMAFALGQYDGMPARIARVSFTGDRSYEISVPASKASRLFDHVLSAGARYDVFPLGLEAVLLLRAEKGYIIVGKDTDGTTMPHDIGFPGPRDKRQDDYVGNRSLFTDAASAYTRRQLVGLVVEDGEPLAAGAHAIATAGDRKRSIGYVTSSYFSPTLNAPIALALIEREDVSGDRWLTIQHLGHTRRARVVPPCFIDPKGERLNA